MAIRKIILRPEGGNDFEDEVYPVTSADIVIETSDKKIMTYAERDKLTGIEDGAQVNTVSSVNGKIGSVVITSDDLGAAPISHVGSTGSAHGLATSSADGFMSSADKVKLDTVASGAQVNSVTSVNAKTGAVNITASDVGAAPSSHVGASGSAHGVATTSINGFMSASDKTKLDTLSSASVTSVNSKTGAVTLNASDVGAASSAHSHSTATTGTSGFMSATDKTKLDGIATGAQVNTVTSVAGRTGAVTISASDIGSGTFSGIMVANNNTSYSTKQTRNIILSTSNPSGGSNGDIWIKYV